MWPIIEDQFEQKKYINTAKVMVDEMISSCSIKRFNSMLHCFLLVVNLCIDFILITTKPYCAS